MIEIFIVAFLIILNGCFVLSELSLVSARRTRLQAMAESGWSGAKTALKLTENPGKFLSTMQIGITLIGILTGAFSGSLLGDVLSADLKMLGISARLAESLGFGIVVTVITYASIVLGELLPKRLALRKPEQIACFVAKPISALCWASTPVAWILDASTSAIFKILGIKAEPESSVTDEEIRSIVEEAEKGGIIETEELHLISGVMRLSDRAVKGVMTPRTDVDWIDLGLSEEEQREILINTQRSRLPVGNGSTEGLIGVVQTRELLAKVLAGKPLDVISSVQKAPLIPDSANALDALAVLRSADVPMALVHDEYGHFEGLVTPANLLEAIAGVFQADNEGEEVSAQKNEDGSWILAGWLPVDEMSEHLSIRLENDRDYFTAAGYILAELGRLPDRGEKIKVDDWQFEILDLSANRIEKIKASQITD